MAFSSRLKYERELRGWSQAKLAQEVGTTSNTISNWERGIAQPSPFFRQQLVVLLGKNPHELELVVVAEDLLDSEAIFELEEPVPPHVKEEAKEQRELRRTTRNIYRQRLLGKVHTFWIRGVLEQSLSGSDSIILNLQEEPGAIENPWQEIISAQHVVPRPLPSDISITKVYNDANGELLLLGEPGSGKTTLLLMLARDLLERAELDEYAPMPIIFNLSSWTEKRQPLVTWLAEELHNKYQVPRKLSQTWIENDQILPLLDGLDEVSALYYTACIDAINTYRQEHGLIPMVVCSRRTNYLAQNKRLLLHNTVSVQPLTSEQVDSYLANASEQQNAIRAAVQADPILQELVTTPLMLSILTLAYQNTPITDLFTAETPEGRRRQIFETYVQRMLERRGKFPYTAQQTIHWLSWLAQQLLQHNQTQFSIERMQIDWLPEERLRNRYRRLLGNGLFGILLGGVTGLGFILFIMLVGWHGNLALSCAEIIGIGLMGGLIAGYLDKQVEGSLFSWQNLRRTLMAFFIFGPIFGLGSTFAHIDSNLKIGETSELVGQLEHAFIFGLAGGMIGAFIVGLRLIRKMDGLIQPAETVAWSWKGLWRGLGTNQRKSLFLGCTIPLSIGLSFGAIIGLIILYNTRSISASLVALLGGAIFGLFVGPFSVAVITLVKGLIGGLSKDLLPDHSRIQPNQGIWLSARNGLFVGILSGLITFLVFTLTFLLFAVLIKGISLLLPSQLIKVDLGSPLFFILVSFLVGLPLILSVGLLIGLQNGGDAWIQHGLLRLLLWRAGCVPWHYPRFLDHAAERVLLHKVGGGYIFVHRLLLEYFASLNTPPPALQKELLTAAKK